MPKKLLSVLLLLFCARAFAIDFPIEVSEYIDDIKIDAYIKEEDLYRTSQWTPFESPPPLSVKQALSFIQEDAKSEIDFSKTQVIGVELKPVPHHKSYWHYLVKLKTISDGESEPLFFIVLMDGKVISAIKEPDAIK
jgi:hypothetical protein